MAGDCVLVIARYGAARILGLRPTASSAGVARTERVTMASNISCLIVCCISFGGMLAG